MRAGTTTQRLTTTTRATRALLAAVLAAAVVLLGGAPGASAQEVRLEGPVGDGVVLRERGDAGPVSSVEITVQPGAPVRFVPVLSGERVDGGREVVSSMCDRVGGVACVNANYAVCPSCGQPLGGIVRDGELVRTPTPIQDQVSVIDGRLTLEPWPWSVGLWVPGAEHRPSVEAHGVNVAPIHDGIVAYTPAFGTHTDAPPGSFELIMRAPRGLRTGVGVRQQVELLKTHTDGAAPIPWDGVVLSGLGRGADDLWAFVETHKASLVELVSNTAPGLTQSFAGHPVLLRDGQRQWLDPADNKVMARHPRTIIGWNDHGAAWLVLVDGRQRRSRGMTLAEATDRMLELGATHAVNLDGGGSSTMVTSCPSASGWCLRNRPSDGRQRNVWVALAVAPAAPSPEPAPVLTAGPAPEATTTTSTTTTAPTTTTTTAHPDPTTTTSTTVPTATATAPPADRAPLGTGEADHAPLVASNPATGVEDGLADGGTAMSALASSPVLAAHEPPGTFRDRPEVVATALVLVILELGLLTHLVCRRRRTG